jgi:hypothetical protein
MRIMRNGFAIWMAVLAMGALAQITAAQTATAQPAPAKPAATTTAPVDPAIAAEFSALTRDHRRNLNDLYSMRGIAPIAGKGELSIGLVQSFLTKPLARNWPAPYPKGSAVLFYAQSDTGISAFLIGQEGLIAHAKTKVTRLRLSGLIANFRGSLGVDTIKRSRAPRWRGERAYQPFVGPERDQFDSDAKALAAQLLPPAIKDGLGGVRHLIIVANGEIASNPFSALPLSGGKQLVDRMSVSISASLFDVDQMIRPWAGRKSLGNMLVLGNPVVPKDPNWDVPPLPGAEDEAKALAGRLGVPVYVGAAADKARFMADASAADSLYIAAHATSDPREPLTGGFVMLSGPDTDQAFLRAKEVQTMGLSASIAVLSACQTGLGMAHEGGTIGLARSFQKSGVPRVVMSLWSVSDEATVYLMDRFSEHMMTAVPAEAMRLAMLDARARYDDPSLWAPFTIFGTPR